MRQQGQYTDSGDSRMAAAQMQYMAAQRMQNSGMNHFPSQAPTSHAAEEHQGQWQWDRDDSKDRNSQSPFMYKEGHGRDPSRPLYQDQRSDLKQGFEEQSDIRTQPFHVEMEVGYKDNNLPQTVEGLEQKFIQDIMKLTKELQDAEDKENARHRERLNEINAQYQKKIVDIRTRQASHRDQFLREESKARYEQYQQTSMANYRHSSGPSETHGFGSVAAAAGALGDAQGTPTAGNFGSYREETEFLGNARNRGFESRGQYPGGRAYNSGGRYF